MTIFRQSHAVLFALLVASSAYAELRPDEDAHEVKVPLGDDLATSLDLPVEIRNYFAVEGQGERVRMEFLDTTANASPDAEWIIRRRAKEKDGEFTQELTIKRRFKRPDTNLDAAVSQAIGQMASVSGELVYQGEWSPNGLTLSVSLSKGVQGRSENLGDDLELRNLAGELVRAKLGTVFPSVNLDRGRVFGPVDGKRFKGKLPGGGKVTIEVFRACKTSGSGFDYLTEVSAKADDVPEAKTKLQALSSQMTTKYWLDTAGTSKTAEIIRRYSK